jgi:hypothetical protein
VHLQAISETVELKRRAEIAATKEKTQRFGATIFL